MKKPFFSVVIPTLNEEKFLPRLLKDLQDQIWQDFEVIHIDGQSEDKTVAKAQSFSDKLDIRSIPHKVRNVSEQRNAGGKLARGEWLIFLDADVRLDSDFLLGVRYKIATTDKKHRHLDVFSTLISLNDADKAKTKHVASMHTINSFLQATSRSGSPRLFGAMIGVRRELFKHAHFNPNTKFAEDIEFVKDCIEAGGKYRLFRAPTYKYDMRRWDDKSLLTTAAEAAKLQLQHLTGQTDAAAASYDMSGGTHYQRKK